jgi:ParB-like chromosome segregation protein Spo0J
MKAPVRWAKGVEKLLVPIDSVRQHPDNPNNGSVEDLIDSIKINGFNTVLTVEEGTGYILAGNHRWQALHAMGATHVPVIYAAPSPDGDHRRYMIADNWLGQMAVLDKGLAAQILQDLQESELGLAGTGVTDEDVDRMLIDLAQAAPPDTGMGGLGVAPSGIWQVVVEFDNEGDRDALCGELESRFEHVRKVSL